MPITLPRPWAAHSQIEWENRAADASLPMWLRAVCFAYGRHQSNGHATFNRGQLLWLLGKPPNAAQPFRKADKGNVQKAISTAVRHGWLSEGSCSECLIVPAHAIEGPNGNAAKACPVHERKRSRRPAASKVVSQYPPRNSATCMNAFGGG